MHKHRTPQGLQEHALIDRALLELLLGDDHPWPWAIDELERAVGLPGNTLDGLRRLRASRLIHRWNDLSTPSRPAVRFHQITQSDDSDSIHEHHDDRALLEYLLADGAGAPLTDEQVYEAFGEAKRVAITNSLSRLDGDGLIERRNGRSISSEAARRLDELMKL
jgi:hypothetical protein